jgi:hypothetical protein
VITYEVLAEGLFAAWHTVALWRKQCPAVTTCCPLPTIPLQENGTVQFDHWLFMYAAHGTSIWMRALQGEENDPAPDSVTIYNTVQSVRLHWHERVTRLYLRFGGYAGKFADSALLEALELRIILRRRM